MQRTHAEEIRVPSATRAVLLSILVTRMPRSEETTNTTSHRSGSGKTHTMQGAWRRATSPRRAPSAAAQQAVFYAALANHERRVGRRLDVRWFDPSSISMQPVQLS